MNKKTNSKLITSYLPHGTGAPLIKLLKDETGICTGNVKNCRGTGSSAHNLNASDYDSWIEVDVLDVVVDADRAEEVFNFIYEKAGIREGNHGFIMQSNLIGATNFSLPNLPEEEF